MFCKYCGKKLPDVAVFCSGCGKSQSKPSDSIPVACDPQNTSGNSKLVAGKKWVFYGALLLMVLAGAYRNIRSYDFVQHLSVEHFAWIYTAIGVIAVLALWRMGKICLEKIKFSALWLPVVFILLSEFFYDLAGIEQSISMQMDVHYTVGMILGTNCGFLLEITLGAECLWQWALFILFLCLQSGTLNLKKGVHIIIPVLMFAWSFAVSLFINSCLTEYFNVPEESFQFSRDYSGRYIMGMLVRRSVCYFFVYLAGSGQLRKVQTALFPVLILLGGVVLLGFLHIGGAWRNAVNEFMYISANIFTLSHLFGLLVFLKRKRGR